MNTVEKSTVYFKEAGPRNTGTILKTVKKYIETKEIKDSVVASTAGITGAKAAKLFQGCNVTVVAHSHGFKETGRASWTKNSRKRS